jgi:aryl-alcohol dehydrogenase-like predicted oxidoreductase
VSCLGLGGGLLGGFRRAIREDAAPGIVGAADETGGRLFDTSPLYGFGRSDLRLGIPGTLSRAEVLAHAQALALAAPAGQGAEVKQGGLLHPAASVPSGP